MTQQTDRISVMTGNILLDMGLVSKLPKAFLWFYRYLECNGERLGDREMMPLVLMISLEEGYDSGGLRLKDLPSRTPVKSLRNYQTKWKRMGLMFTARQFFSPAEASRYLGISISTPRFKNTIYDLTNLFYNVSLIAQEWIQRNADYQAEQKRNGIAEPEPYTFPDDYVHEMVLCPDVARRIVTGAYERGGAGRNFSRNGSGWYIASHWWNAAHEMLGLSPDLAERASDNEILEQIQAGTLVCQMLTNGMPGNYPQVPQNGALGNDRVPQNGALGSTKYPKTGHLAATKCPKTGHSLIEEEKEEEEEEGISFLLSRFAAHKNDPAYQPSEREREQARDLLDKGYAADQIAEVIDQVFHSRPPNANPIRSFGFMLSHVHRRLHPSEKPSTEVGLTGATAGRNTRNASRPTGDRLTGMAVTGVPLTADAERAPQPANDPMSPVYALLEAASVRGMEGVEDTVYDIPGVRLGLLRLLEMPEPFSPNEIRSAVLAAVSRGIAPDRLVGYAQAVLENARQERRETELERARREERDAERLQREVEEATRTTGPPGQPGLFDADAPDPPGAPPRLWEQALGELELQMTRATFNTWLKPASFAGWTPANNGTPARATLSVPNGYVKDWLRNRLIAPILRTLAGIAGEEVEVQFIVEEADDVPV